MCFIFTHIFSTSKLFISLHTATIPFDIIFVWAKKLLLTFLSSDLVVKVDSVNFYLILYYFILKDLYLHIEI